MCSSLAGNRASPLGLQVPHSILQTLSRLVGDPCDGRSAIWRPAWLASAPRSPGSCSAVFAFSDKARPHIVWPHHIIFHKQTIFLVRSSKHDGGSPPQEDMLPSSSCVLQKAMFCCHVGPGNPFKTIDRNHFHTYLLHKLLATGVYGATRELNTFRSDSNLIVGLGASIGHLNIIRLFEILLQRVQEGVVVGLRHTGVANQQARSFFENSGNLFAASIGFPRQCKCQT